MCPYLAASKKELVKKSIPQNLSGIRALRLNQRLGFTVLYQATNQKQELQE